MGPYDGVDCILLLCPFQRRLQNIYIPESTLSHSQGLRFGLSSLFLDDEILICIAFYQSNLSTALTNYVAFLFLGKTANFFSLCQT